jgi:hypothetical protein
MYSFIYIHICSGGFRLDTSTYVPCLRHGMHMFWSIFFLSIFVSILFSMHRKSFEPNYILKQKII